MELVTAERWLTHRTYDPADYPLERVLAAKRQTISVIVPTKECSATLPPLLSQVLELQEAGLVDEVLVVDAASTDGTPQVAARLGARVVQEDDLLPEFGPARGKGDAMWRGLAATGGELVAYLDGDSQGLAPTFALGLLAPLVCEAQLAFVKGAFSRPFRPSAGGPPIPDGGGRVTELMARPLINLHFPQLSGFAQPLAGEVAARRALLERLPFPVGYGVEIAMLIDALRLAGIEALAQVDLGTRQNRHQPLQALSSMAYAVLVAAERRLGRIHDVRPYVLPLRDEPPHVVPVDERPPLRRIDGRRGRADDAEWLESPPTATDRSSFAGRSP